MRRFILAAALSLAASSAFAQVLAVQIDQSARIALPAGARDVMVGNPAIADVSMSEGGALVVLGRSYGQTNLLVVNGAGRTILERQVLVTNPEAGHITIVRGRGSALVMNYACAPRCERTPLPGEIDSEYKAYAEPYASYAGRAAEGRNAQKPAP